MKFEEHLDHGNGGGYLLAARLYTSLNDTQKTDKEGNNPEGKNSTNCKGLQGLQPLQKSNTRRDERKKTKKRKQNITIRPLTPQENGYPALTTGGNRKWEVKLHPYVKKKKQRGQRRETKIHDSIIILKRAFPVNGNVKWCNIKNSTKSKTQSCRQRTYIMTS